MLEILTEETPAQIHNGEFLLVFISPEAVLTKPKLGDMLQSPVYQENLVAFVVDKAGGNVQTRVTSRIR